MKKIPTLFVREFDNHKPIGIRNKVAEGMEWVLEGKGTATVKIDGSCCAIIGGKFYRRYDAKRGKQPPEGATACCEPDPVTGHWPHWLPVTRNDPGAKWYAEAYDNSNGINLEDGTYEAIGPHFRNNPYGLEKDTLVKHGFEIIEDCPRSFSGIAEYLKTHYIEGIVFWKDNAPQCKIRRKDFGYKWPDMEREK